MITKTIATEHGVVISNTDVTRLDNGQVLLHIVSKLGKSIHEHRVTVGAENGQDAVAGMSEVVLQQLIQQHLDEKRNEAAQVLAGRARVAKISGNLI